MQALREYSLPPDKYVQAVEYAHARDLLYLAGFVIPVLVVWAMLKFRLGPALRRFHPVWIVSIVTLIIALCELPAGVYGHLISRQYHISIQSWPSWFADWGKAQSIALVLSVLALWPLYWLMQRSPKRWWLYAWLASLPLLVLGAYADPLLIEPLFDDFQPISASHPQLIRPIEQLLARAHISIPADHLLEMRASEKTTALNAYVSGFGPSRRLVLYDTIIRAEKGPPLLSTIGHELGHEALHHIAKGLLFGAAGTLAGLALLHLLLRWFVGHWGPRLDIRSPADWASLPAFLLIANLLIFASEPIDNAVSRWQEHQADVYALQVTRGVVADPGQAAAEAFQIEGEHDLEEPHPSPLIVFWLYNHPPVSERLRFALGYGRQS